MITGYNWELYNVAEDPTETNDLAAQDAGQAQGDAGPVLRRGGEVQRAAARQLVARPLEHAAPEPDGGPQRFHLFGRAQRRAQRAARRDILDQAYTITAEVEIPEGGAEGMIVTEGGRFGGYGLFLSKGEFGFDRGKVVFLYNLLDLKRTTWEGPELEPGKHTIVFDFKPDGPGLGKGGTGVLSVDGKEVARNTLDHTTPITFPEDETFDVGLDTRTPLALLEYRYDVPFRFTGKIDKLTFELDPSAMSARVLIVVAALGEGRDRRWPC